MILPDEQRQHPASEACALQVHAGTPDIESGEDEEDQGDDEKDQ